MLDRIFTVDLGRLDARPNGWILDLGCGMARHLQQVVRGPYRVVGLDVSRTELERARYVLGFIPGWHPDTALTLLHGDGTCLPFADGTFDHVICSETLEHVPDDDGVLDEMVRVLRPGGTLGLSVPHHFVEALLWRVNPRIPTYPGGHLRIYGPGELARKLERRGVVVYDRDRREAFESVYWFLVHLLGEDHPLAWKLEDLREFLDDDATRRSPLWAKVEQGLGRLIPKSTVLYGRKPVSPSRSRGTPTTTVA